jgi:tetratricopeptide (TPR) repeat protein
MAKPTASSPETRTAGFRARRWLAALALGSCLLIVPSTWAQMDRYAEAESLVRNHHWDEGLSALAPLLQSEPGNLKALNLAGLASIGKGDVQQAQDYFRKAIALNPAFSPALKNLAISEFNAQKFPAALEHLQAAESITPDDPAVHLYLGEIFYRQKSYARAAAELGRIDGLAERSPAAGAHLAISYLRSNDRNKAETILGQIRVERLEPPTQFEMALALDDAGDPQSALPFVDAVYAQFPGSYDIAFDRMMIETDAKKFLPAIETAKELIARGYDTPELNNALAEAYQGNGDFQLAFDAYRKAIQLAPDEEDNYIDLASLCLDRHSFDTAMKVIDVALSSHPKSGRLVFMRGLIHATEGDSESAEADFRLSERLSPQRDLGAIGLGASFLQNGHYEEAVQNLRTKLRDKPNDPSLLYLFAENLIRSGVSPGDPKYVEAQAALEKSTSLDPGLCLPHVALGMIYLDERRDADAAAQFEMARRVDPAERSAYSHLAVAYRRLGEVDKAKEVLSVLKGMSEQERIGDLARMKASAVDSAQKQMPANSPSTAPR